MFTVSRFLYIIGYHNNSYLGSRLDPLQNTLYKLFLKVVKYIRYLNNLTHNRLV